MDVTIDELISILINSRNLAEVQTKIWQTRMGKYEKKKAETPVKESQPIDQYQRYPNGTVGDWYG